jgi:hypothetical protein
MLFILLFRIVAPILCWIEHLFADRIEVDIYVNEERNGVNIVVSFY